MYKKWPAIFILALMLILTDCRCYRRQIVVRSVLLEMPTNIAAFSQKLDREKFSELIKTVLEKEPNYHFDPQKNEGEVLHLSVIIPGERRLVPTSLLLSAMLESKDPLIKPQKAFAEISIEEGQIGGREVSNAITMVLQQLFAQRSGTQPSNAEYIKRIEDAASGETIVAAELVAAISVVGEARAKEALMPLIKLIQTTDNLAIANACLAALGELGLPEAMPAIIDFAERKPPIIRRQAIIAARKIGSQTAAEWLLLMAYGSDDLLVRQEAQAALIDVEKKLEDKEQP